NQILMTLMDKVARRHNFRVLFHEKPFKGINGSGKHNNWSMLTNNGTNLLSPGKTPKNNMQFLTFLINTVKAVHDYSDILRASVAVAGNEHRLGAHEAPPAIMSVFIGSQLTNMLDQLEKRVTSKKMTPDEKTELKLDIGKIPEILLDNTDRNRTSPFAFTGNRFEFRAVGSSANVASPMITLNTVVANQLVQFKKEVEALIEKNIKKDQAIFQVLKKYIIESKKIRFEGNGYGEDWIKEAAKRGLSNIADVPEALKAFITKHTKDVFEKSQILTDRELEARYDIRLEIYTKKIQIEARVLGDLIRNHVIPTLIKYQNVLINNVRGLKELYPKDIYEKMAKPQLNTITEISERIAIVKEAVDEMIEARKKANTIENIRDKASEYSKVVVPYFEKIRYHVDKLELIVDDEIWPFPKYREMLFTR
ncbi:MAG: glutamine synthetase type III, partial [Bacteroidales bacterium]|nr:glutamine synthetase type III [Bacteroidales bacterium]